MWMTRQSHHTVFSAHIVKTETTVVSLQESMRHEELEYKNLSLFTCSLSHVDDEAFTPHRLQCSHSEGRNHSCKSSVRHEEMVYKI